MRNEVIFMTFSQMFMQKNLEKKGVSIEKLNEDVLAVCITLCSCGLF